MVVINEITFHHGQASVRLVSLGEDRAQLSNLISKTRGRGHARKVMHQLVNYADKMGIIISLTVQQYDNPNRGGLDNDELEAFYAKFGFKRVEGYKRPRRMIRYPSQDLHIL